MYFTIFKGKKGEWYWNLKAKNHKIVAQGEGYKQKAAAAKTIAAIIKAIGANGKDMTIKVIMPTKKKKK